MMSLKKWNPFKFKRNRPDTRVPVQHRATTAASPLERTLWNPWPVMPDWWRDPWSAIANADRWFGDFSPTRFTPSLDVVDEGSALRVSVELPGLDKSDVELVAEDGYLTLKGEKRYDNTSEENGCYRIERARGAFQRTIPLPDEVDAAQAQASFDNGVLSIRVPKRPEATGAGARRIALQ